jgi:hypothetical protein
MAFPPIEDSVTLGIIVINVILTLILVYIYMKNYRAISSKVTLGFLFFAGVFLVENIVDFLFYNMLLTQGLFTITSFPFAVNFIEMIGLVVLVWVTWK